MAIGSDGTGWIEFSDYELARTIGVVALALILFEGGLTSGVIEIRPVLGTAVSLALIATPLTALISGATAVLLFDFDLKEGLLVGAVLASTDGAAIFALLRNSTLRRRLARTLEGESGLNDPVAVLLVLALIDKLALAMRSAAALAERDLIVLLVGGPGQAATEVYPSVAAGFAPLLEHRNVLLLDQRGTGGSHPLRCKDDPDDFTAATGGNIDLATSPADQTCLG